MNRFIRKFIGTIVAATVWGCAPGDVDPPSPDAPDVASQGADPDDLTGIPAAPDVGTPSEDMSQHWLDVVAKAKEAAALAGDFAAHDAIVQLEAFDAWVEADFESQRLVALEDAPEWVFDLIEEIEDAADPQAERRVSPEIIPGMRYLIVADRDPKASSTSGEEIAQRAQLFSCAPTWCPADQWSTLAAAQTSLRSWGFHQVPGWIFGGSDYDYALPRPYCKRNERVICQSNCTSKQCTNPPTGKWRTYEQGPEPDPEVYACAWAWVVPAGFASWTAYVWAYHRIYC